MHRDRLLLFAPEAGRELGRRVADALGVPLTEHEEREFEDGEHKSRPLVSVRDADVFVVESLHRVPGRSVNDRLCRLLFFLGALGDAGAARVTAVVPYLCYARKDRRTKLRDPVTTRYVARLFEAMGTDRVVTVDVHNQAAFENAYRIGTDHLEARTLFVDHFASLPAEGEWTVASPDIGGVKRAEAFRLALEERIGRPVSAAFMEKRRSEGVVTGETVTGEVEQRHVVLLDDMISTGTTLARASSGCRARGALTVSAAATHLTSTAGLERLLGEGGLDRLVVTDTVTPGPPPPAVDPSRLVVLSCAPMIAAAIRRIHEGGSVAEVTA